MAMAGDQPVVSYTDTTAQKKAITDLISVIDPSDIPVVKYFGLDGDPGKFRVVNWPSTTLYWLEDELNPMTGSLAASAGSADTTISVSDGTNWRPGDVLEVDSEMVWVSAITTDTLTVTRNYGGTQATHANSATVTLITHARQEGADADFKRGVTDKTEVYNYTQIFSEDLKVSRTANKISQYGIAKEFDYQAAKALESQLRLVEKAFFYGQRKSGSATAPRAFGGIETFASNNTANLSAAALVESDMMDLMQAIWEDGGHPDLLICNGWVKRKIASFYGDNVRTTRDEKKGGIVIDEVDTDFGTLKVLMSRWCPATKLYVVESGKVGFVSYDPFFQEPLAKVGDSVRGQVVGEYSLVIQNGKAHGYIRSISTSS